MDIRDKKAKDILDDISYYLKYGNNEEARKLWWVLSALRGPDNASYIVKMITTEVIRTVAFGDGVAGSVGALSSPDSLDKMERRDNPRFWDRESEGMPIDHFFHHAKMAFESLGIQWGPIPIDLKVFML